MRVLGIESSCDETGVALVEADGDAAPRLLAQALHSQVDMHADYGGVVPELASRDHIRRVLPLTREVLARGRRRARRRSTSSPTRAGPGLAGALLVGAGVACALAAALGKPALGVHHLEGHLLSPFLSADPPAFPVRRAAGLGRPHAAAARSTTSARYELLGETIDDAAGEAFDKSAKLLGLRLSGRAGAGAARPSSAIPRRSRCRGRCCTARPRLLVRRPEDGGAARTRASSGASLRAGARRPGGVDAGGDRRRAGAASRWRALERTGLRSPRRRRRRRRERAAARAADAACAKRRRPGALPELALCTDNGAMIALAAAMRLQRGIAAPSTDYAFDVLPRWPLSVADAARRAGRLSGPASVHRSIRRCSAAWRPRGTFLASVSVSTPFSNLACERAWSTSAGSTTLRA